MADPGKPVFRKSLPEGATEHIGLGAGSATAVVEVQDGLLMIAGRGVYRSGDSGLTWERAEAPDWDSLGETSCLSCIRLSSGRLALAHLGRGNRHRGSEMFNWNPFFLSVSDDEGRSWSGEWPMNLLGGPYYDTMIQMPGGRMVMPSRICHSNNHHSGLEYARVSSYGFWKGRRLQVSGHYHYPEVDIASVSYSDDEGRTWQMCRGQLMGWFDAEGIPNGRGGITAVDEPGVAACPDGRLMMMARSTVGRLVQSYSEDEGETWTPVVPSDLAASYSPPRIRRIPGTGDLMCVWNQTSREEILRGYRRGRLSAAVSSDNGASWSHFRTIELSGGMEDLARVPPQYPVSPVVALPELGTLPEDFATFDYANVWFHGDRVLLMYHRSWVEPDEDTGEAVTLGERKQTARKPGELVLRVYPLTWFYDRKRI